MRIGFLLLLAFGLHLHAQPLPIPQAFVDDPQAGIRQLEGIKTKRALQWYQLAKCHAFLNHEDTAFHCMTLAKEGFEKERKTAWAKEVALEAYQLVSSQENYERFGKAYLQEFWEYANHPPSDRRLALCHNEFAKNAVDALLMQGAKRPDSALAIYRKALRHAVRSADAMVIGKTYGNMGVMHSEWAQYADADRCLNRALPYILEHGDRFELFANYFNRGNIRMLQTDYRGAIDWFGRAERIPLPYYRDRTRRKLFQKLMAAHDSIGNEALRKRYTRLYNQLDKTIRDREQNIAIHALDVQHEVQAKDRQISLLMALKERFEHHRILFLSLLALVFFLALYSFIRWKKVDRNRRRLERSKQEIEREHSRTVEQLEKVSQLVIEDHIVLKNRSKLYLDNLMYVKADDHYLHFVPVEGKPSFLRGTLAEISEELPPNFRRSHRSYIVNLNFVKSANSRAIILKNNEALPVSRDFKL